MRMRNPKDKDEVINSCDFFYDEFKDDKPIHLEIGMGKGKFILEMALKYPQYNFVGVEKYSSVASVAIKKIREVKPKNLKILIMDAQNLGDILEGKVDTIYLNFSDPWPKERTKNRRLTSVVFLRIYDDLFYDEKKIIMKTDNLGLFASSLVSLSNYGYSFSNVNLDLHHSDIPNVLTEYEKKFQELGVKINYLDAKK